MSPQARCRNIAALAVCCVALGRHWELSAVAAQEADGQDIARLTSQLESPEFDRRLAAALSLVRCGEAARHEFPTLLQKLAAEDALDWSVAARVIYARPRAATDEIALIAALESSTKARVAASWELSRLGESADLGAARALQTALANPDKHERNFTAIALGLVAPPSKEAVSALLDVLQDRGSQTSQQANYKYPRIAAAISLGLAGPQAHPAIPALREALAEKGSWEQQRAAACFALGRIGQAANVALPSLREAAAEESLSVRTHAKRAIQKLTFENRDAAVAKPNRSVAELIRTLSDRRIEDAQLLEGLRLLGEFAGSETIGKKGAKRAAPAVHESISLALGYLDSLRQPPAPEQISREEAGGALSAASRQYVMALGGVQQGIGPALLAALERAEDDERVLAARALGAMPAQGKAAIPALRSAESTGHWPLRHEAHLALQKLEVPGGE